MKYHFSFRSLIKERAGIAAVELAMILPLFMLLLFGMMEFSSIFEVKRRLAQIDTTLGDLLGRSTEIDDDTVLDIMAAAETIMIPYSLDALAIRLTAIEIDEDGNSSLLWSRSSNSGHTAEPSLSVPAGLGVDKQVILVETHYQTSLQLAFLDVADLDLETSGYILPRTANMAWNGESQENWAGTTWQPPDDDPEGGWGDNGNVGNDNDDEDDDDEDEDDDDDDQETKKGKKGKKGKRDRRRWDDD